MVKFRLYYNKDKACAWLDEMAGKGYRLVRFAGGFWTFEPCTPGAYSYHIDFATRPFRVSEDYRQLMEDMGFQIISVWGPWVFLETAGETKLTALYTDSASFAEQRTKMRRFFAVMCAVMFVLSALMFVLTTDVLNESALLMTGIATGTVAGIFCLIFFDRSQQLQQEINEARAQCGEGPAPRGRISTLLPAAILLQACAWITHGYGVDTIFRILMAISLVCIFVGILRTRWMNEARRPQKEGQNG